MFRPQKGDEDLNADQGGKSVSVYHEVQKIIEAVVTAVRAGDTVLVMSNGGFEGIQQRLLDALAERGA